MLRGPFLDPGAAGISATSPGEDGGHVHLGGALGELPADDGESAVVVETGHGLEVSELGEAAPLFGDDADGVAGEFRGAEDRVEFGGEQHGFERLRVGVAAEDRDDRPADHESFVHGSFPLVAAGGGIAARDMALEVFTQIGDEKHEIFELGGLTGVGFERPVDLGGVGDHGVGDRLYLRADLSGAVFALVGLEARGEGAEIAFDLPEFFAFEGVEFLLEVGALFGVLLELVPSEENDEEAEDRRRAGADQNRVESSHFLRCLVCRVLALLLIGRGRVCSIHSLAACVRKASPRRRDASQKPVIFTFALLANVRKCPQMSVVVRSAACVSDGRLAKEAAPPPEKGAAARRGGMGPA